jgi:serine/threonine-protein kinase
MDGADDEDRTVFLPGGTAPPVAPSSPSAPPPFAPSAPPSAAPRREGSGIQVGDVLNHIFEVRRFIARGGMGEVFEGANVNSEERVAIKVMLPALAADPNIQAMFRKEARTLTRLSDPALVQYRVLAQEPQLGVLYIVTEYIDGANLCDLLGTLKPSGAELVGLARRLAGGLAVAHGLGAIHRDISPDNILLEDGRLDRAKVIDFGIAKDLDPGAKTVVGDGFAGKMGYVAPEQLGDFDRQVGRWTDVYSLGLVLLAVATGRNPDLSGSFVDAIEKRRRGPDLSGVPAELAPTLAAMVAPDPAKRLRSMDAVLDALRPGAAEATVMAPAASSPPASPPTPPAVARKADGTNNRPLVIGGAVGAAALLAGIGYLAFGDTSRPASSTGVPAATRGGTDIAPIRASIDRALPGIACSWLDVTGVSEGPDGVVAALAGASSDPAGAQAAVAGAVAAGGGSLASTDFADVAPINREMCTSLDVFRRIRGSGPSMLSMAQRKFEMSRLPNGTYQGQIGARIVITLDIGDPSRQFALYGMEPNGKVETLFADRKALADYLAADGGHGLITALGGDRYRLQLDANHSGWSGFLLLTGRGGLPTPLVETATGKRAADWPSRFAAAAAANGWQAHMAWVRTVDEIPN